MRLKSLSLLTIISLSLFTYGCGGGSGEESATTDMPQASTAAQAPTGTAAISGTVTFTGTAPNRTRLRLDEDCRVLHSEPVLAENVIVNENGTLKDVFVYVKEGLGDAVYAAPAEPVVFDQHGCMYTPHVFGIQVDQTLKILNSDPFQHNIHALPETNRPFNFSMPKQGDERERVFKVPEVMVKIKCDVHPWMGAWAGVLGHPYYSVSGDDGTFHLNNLPAGNYVIEAWHEQYGTATQTVTLGDGESKTVTFSFGEGA